MLNRCTITRGSQPGALTPLGINSDDVAAPPHGVVDHGLTPDQVNGDGTNQDENDAFSDWYGYESGCDLMCIGRREAVLGTAWMDEAAFFGPPPSRLRIALDSQTEWSEVDPSSRKVMRDERQGTNLEQAAWEDELHCTWTDELAMASPAVEGDFDDDDTEALVEKFLHGGWSRNSLCDARFRTAATSRRSGKRNGQGHEPDGDGGLRAVALSGRSAEGSGEGGGFEAEEDEAADEAQPSPPNGVGGGMPRRSPGGIRLTPGTPFCLPFCPTLNAQNQNPPYPQDSTTSLHTACRRAVIFG